jgi:arylsulfatase A-like enzyme
MKRHAATLETSQRWLVWRDLQRCNLMLLAAVFAAVPSSVGAADEKPPRRPNVLVIVADDLGYGDVGFQGGKQIPTPNLDSLAAGGTRCTNGYVSCPVCSPTRAGLVTGRYQQRFGHEFNPGGGGVRDDFGLPLTETTVASTLKAAGYKTGIVGKWHLGSSPKFTPLERGYDEFFGFLGGAHSYLIEEPKANAQPIFRGRDEVDEKEYLTDAIGREATSFVERHREQPFLLYVTFNAVHLPQEAPAKYLDRFKNIEGEKRQKYAAMLSALDENVGLVLGKLKDLKLDSNTLVFFISDNGGPTQGNASSNNPLQGNKGSVWEGGIRVPFVVRWPGHVPAGAVYEQPVISLDIAATAAAASEAKLDNGKPIDGVNLLPFLAGDVKSAPHETLYWRFGPQWAIRHGDLKLLKTGDKAPQLFDLKADIGEAHDLAKDKPEVVEQLTKTYQQWNGQLEEPRWRPEAGARQQKQQKRKAARAS